MSEKSTKPCPTCEGRTGILVGPAQMMTVCPTCKGAGTIPSDTKPCTTLHTKQPDGYIQWDAWAEKKSKTHHQVKCPNCGLYAIWVKGTIPSDTPVQIETPLTDALVQMGDTQSVTDSFNALSTGDMEDLLSQFGARYHVAKSGNEGWDGKKELDKIVIEVQALIAQAHYDGYEQGEAAQVEFDHIHHAEQVAEIARKAIEAFKLKAYHKIIINTPRKFPLAHPESPMELSRDAHIFNSVVEKYEKAINQALKASGEQDNE